MDNTNTSTNNENLITKLKTPQFTYISAGIIIFLIIVMYMIFYDVNPSFNGTTKSQQQVIADIFIILFFSLLVVGICIIFLPNLKDFKALFEQIGSVTYVILYTIFAILFYTMMSKDILNDYSYIINPAMLGLGAFSFYKGTTDNYVEKFNINYERIKTLILLFCLITLIITFYNINPGGAVSEYFGYSLLLTIIISVFGFLYLIILVTLSNDEVKNEKNMLSNFSSFGVYGSILFIIFLVIVTVLITSNKDNFFGNKEKSAAVIILLLIICIVWSISLGANLFSDTPNNIADINKMSLFKNSLLFLFGLVISGLLIYWITYNIESLSGNSSTTFSFILNLLLVAVILGLIYKTINVKLPVGNTKKNSFFNLIFNTLLYIPCLISGTFDWVGKKTAGEYNATSTGSFMMLGTVIGLIIAYFTVPPLFNLVSTQGGKQLVNKPVYTDTEYSLGTYEDLNGSDQFDYQYAISCWVFVDSVGPNTNANYNKFTSLLNFGNKPNISYNGKTHTLMITMQQKDLKDVTKNKLIDFDDKGNRIIYINNNFLLQKWNNIIINYNGGTLDVFLNGELVKSSIEVVPYYTFDNLTIGENGGIKGGICNVVYFRRALTSQNVFFLYNTVKDKKTPTLNESNETIMIKNVNQATSSIETVVNQ
jgi:hypothetical protein